MASVDRASTLGPRRAFLTHAANGFGLLAWSALAAEASERATTGPLVPVVSSAARSAARRPSSNRRPSSSSRTPPRFVSISS